jgi:hypothetical protein
LFDDRGFFSPWQLFEWQDDRRAFACLVEPPAFDLRLLVQSAAFTICSDTRQSFDSFLTAAGALRRAYQYIIPAEEIERVRDRLDFVGIDEDDFFPTLTGLRVNCAGTMVEACLGERRLAKIAAFIIPGNDLEEIMKSLYVLSSCSL